MEVKKAVPIPVVGSGDIRTPEDAVSMLDQTGADAVMIGRQALGNPWIFKQVMERLQGVHVSDTPGIAERLELSLHHLDILAEEVSERYAVLNIRKFLGWYSRGARNGAVFRQRIFRAETIEDVKCIVREFQVEAEEYEKKNLTNREMLEL